MQIKIGNSNINYEVLGEGTPVILLHGWLTDMETMRPIASSLMQSFKVYLVDVIGFGKSDALEKPINTDEYGDFLSSFCKELNIEDPILIGHSNGGRIIINAVGRKLVNPRKIVLIDSAGLKPKRPLKYYIKIGIVKCGKAVLNILPVSNEVKEKFRNRFGSSDYKASSEVLKETMKIILNEDQTENLKNISVPTLLIWGSLDTATPIEDGRKMEKLIDNAGLVEYPNGTHFSYLENIQNCNVVLNEFLKNDK